MSDRIDRTNYGQVDVDLGARTLTLVPSLRAFQKIQQRFGGLSQALQAMTAINIETVAAVVAAGAKVGQSDMEQLREEIFNVGVINVMAKASEYLSLLLNPTGKEREAQGEDDAGK